MLSIARSRFTTPLQLAFLITNAFALVSGLVFDRRTPDLFANNAHSKTGWAVTWIATTWVFMALFQIYMDQTDIKSKENELAQPMTVADRATYQRVHDARLSNRFRWSNIFGQGTERNAGSLCGHSRSSSTELDEELFIRQTHNRGDADLHPVNDEPEKQPFLRNRSFSSNNVTRCAVDKARIAIRFFYVVIERMILIQGFVAIMSGTVVYGGIGRGGAVFNVLAHYVKGGIFFFYGLLTLGRWFGAFADFGWAWNVKPTKEVVGRRRAALPSAEFTESFVIWLYGITNIFLEHLAAWGDVWTAQDLEHVSISIMFSGGGLVSCSLVDCPSESANMFWQLGMIVESTKVRQLLNTAVVSSQAVSRDDEKTWLPPRQYDISMNPLPALIIMLLGKMMSSHHQDSMLSTMIHGQWGSMFMAFALARGLTYITLYISPPTSFLPSRPPTELITGFCLISGGITFMLSNKDTVAVLEVYNLDAMFVFTITVGLTALLMAWTTIVVAIKGWAQRNEHSSTQAKRHAGGLA